MKTFNRQFFCRLFSFVSVPATVRHDWLWEWAEAAYYPHPGSHRLRLRVTELVIILTTAGLNAQNLCNYPEAAYPCPVLATGPARNTEVPETFFLPGAGQTFFRDDACPPAPAESLLPIDLSALDSFGRLKLIFSYQLAGLDKHGVDPRSTLPVDAYPRRSGSESGPRLQVADTPGGRDRCFFGWQSQPGWPGQSTGWMLGILLAAAATIYYRAKNHRVQQALLLEISRLQLEKERSLRQERDRIAAEMHDDLGAGLTTIRFLSLLAREKETDPVNAGRIDKIASSASEVLEKMADIIWVMNSRNDTLENLAHHLRRYAGDYLDTHGIGFHFDMPEPLPARTLSGEQRRALLLAMKECLHNVVKHAGATEVWLRLSVNGPLEITVEDNGKGMPPDLMAGSTGNGLYNLRKRMEDHGGSAIIDTRRGTTVVLRTELGLSSPL